MRLAGRERGRSLPLTSGTGTPAPQPQGCLVLHPPFPLTREPLLTKASLSPGPPPIFAAHRHLSPPMPPTCPPAWVAWLGLGLGLASHASHMLPTGLPSVLAQDG